MKESYYSVKVFIVECVGASIIEVRGFECKKYMSKSFSEFFSNLVTSRLYSKYYQELDINVEN